MGDKSLLPCATKSRASVDAVRSRAHGPPPHRVIDGLSDVAMGFFLRWEWHAAIHPAKAVCEVSILVGHKRATVGEDCHASLDGAHNVSSQEGPQHSWLSFG